MTRAPEPVRALRAVRMPLQTVARTRPAQVAARARRRGLQALVARRPDLLRVVGPLNGGPYGPPARWAAAPRRAQRLGSDRNTAEDLRAGRLTLAGHVQTRGWPPAWQAPVPTRLWAYHLHYLDWVWALVDQPQDGDARGDVVMLLEDWVASSPPGSSPAWDPYPTARRAWNLCALDAELDLLPAMPGLAGLVDRHYRSLRLSIEDDLGGNHLVADLKALVGLCAWRADHAGLTRFLGRLLRSSRTQVLADGGHEERAPAYHAHVLADLLDVEELLTTTGVPCPEDLALTVAMMREWLAAMRTPAGTLPFFHDGDLHAPEALDALVAGPGPSAPHVGHLAATGYVAVRLEGQAFLAIDVGAPGPPHQPGHSHAGVGSFELWVRGQCVVRNTGSSTYEAGQRRRFERSTAAQNTVVVDGQDQSDLWGAFRIGRIPKVEHVVRRAPSLEVRVEHDGFVDRRGRRIRHRRTFLVASTGMTIHDELTGSGAASVRSTLYTPRSPRNSRQGLDIGPVRVTLSPEFPGSPVVAPCQLADGFGRHQDAYRIGTERSADLPTRWSTTLRWA